MKNFIIIVIVGTFFILQSSCEKAAEGAIDCVFGDLSISINADLDSVTPGLMHFKFNYTPVDDMTLKEVTWNFGDGESQITNGETVDHQYAGSGHYDAVIDYTFSVTDGECNASTTKSINIP
ncbi:MAG: PKD domain-containing protein [Lentimicrobiaceae bacterium]|jgi:hypothetical protein|nr:PKD domain-containing protein [Lentimicrobiaceae bacterium]MCP4911331.1 hypothetical protein [Bacteroidota bacterium]MBT3454061.1 PKD domain-containing protein [Lentimicrobiaceae bacterium]MBT3819179.1 PKD domain-containing protein [Lentimicrobiaceae bacterium]MBT4060608.1 PKD domain-containing protein [Lentimicrobiaceae bacterium]